MFVSLHTHSDHSLRDGFQTVKEILTKVSSMGQTAVALTDHGTMSGCGEGFRYADKYDLKFIAGCEHYLVNDVSIKDRNNQHIILLAKDKIGYRNLNILTTIAHSESNFYFKPRIDLPLLEKYSEGILCSTACLAGCQDKIESLKAIFGDRLYIELHTNGLDGQKEANREWLKLADKYDVKFYAATDSHYSTREQADYQHTWTPYQYKDKDGEGEGYTVDDSLYLHSEEDVREALSYLPRDIVDLAIEETVKVADRVNFNLQWGVNHYPKSKYEDPKYEVRMRTWQGCKSLGISKDQKHIEQIRHEIEVLEKVDYFDYFLIVSDLINWCKENKIRTGAGRGSVVGCDVAYAMGITKVNPLKYGLIFERFTNTERVSPCDIDIDVPRGRRQDVIQHIKDTYGYVYQVVTFNNMADKSAIRRATQALNMPHNVADKLCEKYDNVDDLPEDMKLEGLMDGEYSELVNIARSFRGRLQNFGTHASAVVVMTTDPFDFCAVEKFKDQYNLNYEFKDLEALGLLKLDILGLETLDILDNILESIPEKDRPCLDLLPDEGQVYDMMVQGFTDGVFQLESGMMKGLISKIKPDNLSDLIHIVALGRPGPLQAGITQEFIDRKCDSKKGA